MAGFPIGLQASGCKLQAKPDLPEACSQEPEATQNHERNYNWPFVQKNSTFFQYGIVSLITAVCTDQTKFSDTWSLKHKFLSEMTWSVARARGSDGNCFVRHTWIVYWKSWYRYIYSLLTQFIEQPRWWLSTEESYLCTTNWWQSSKRSSLSTYDSSLCTPGWWLSTWRSSLCTWRSSLCTASWWQSAKRSSLSTYDFSRSTPGWWLSTRDLPPTHQAEAIGYWPVLFALQSCDDVLQRRTIVYWRILDVRFFPDTIFMADFFWHFCSGNSLMFKSLWEQIYQSVSLQLTSTKRWYIHHRQAVFFDAE